MLGIVLFGKFESHFRTFHLGDYATIYTNYSIFIMNLMQFIDFLLFLFIGYYLKNVFLPHDFGIKKNLYISFVLKNIGVEVIKVKKIKMIILQ